MNEIQIKNQYIKKFNQIKSKNILEYVMIIINYLQQAYLYYIFKITNKIQQKKHIKQKKNELYKC